MGSLKGLGFFCALFVLLPALRASDKDALAIEVSILSRHLPFGTILNPIFSADHLRIDGYTRCGDSALFTGMYMAAEAYRYRVTNDPQALANVRTGLAGVNLLVDITGQNLLSRCIVPTDSPYARGIVSEESPNGVYQATLNGRTYYFVGNTSRDAYSGVFYGLGTTYDLIEDAAARANIASLATRLITHLTDFGWNVVMPDGSVSTTFAIRPDQQLTLLEIGRHVNPAQFSGAYSSLSRLASTVPLALGVDAADDKSAYFKFNLDFMNLFNLIRLETDGGTRNWYERGFGLVRGTTDNHRNAFFNLIDRALHGPDGARDEETREDLRAWLGRSRFDVTVDWRGIIPSCGDANTACHPLPVQDRPASDFVWQLNPFQLSNPGSGLIETAGIDYTLPYWMARYYGVIPDPDGPPRAEGARRR
jgi:hypothetical protein